MKWLASLRKRYRVEGISIAIPFTCVAVTIGRRPEPPPKARGMDPWLAGMLGFFAGALTFGDRDEP